MTQTGHTFKACHFEGATDGSPSPTAAPDQSLTACGLNNLGHFQTRKDQEGIRGQMGHCIAGKPAGRARSVIVFA